MSPSEFRELVSGRRHGPRASLIRFGLRLAEAPYTWAVRWRNRRYDTHAAAVHRVAAGVVSVGNLTLGGTGKTPMVAWLVDWFARHGVKVGIVSRGYGAAAGHANDEAMELARRLPGVPHVQDADRVRAAQRAIEEFGCRVLVLDDAFQHRRIARDLDLVLLDALEPLGFGHVFPRGMLREPIDGLRRAQVVGLSRAHLLPLADRAGIRAEVARHAPAADWLELGQSVAGLASFSGAEQPTETLVGQKVVAFCGIGNPAGFRHTLAQCDCQVAAFLEFPDHHAYHERDRARLAAAVRQQGVAALVCTEKDLVKLGADRLADVPLWAIRIDLEILSGREKLEARLEPLARSA